MFNRATIQTCFNTIVGWRNSAQAPTCVDTLTGDLLTSDSGVYYDNYPGVSLQLVTEMLGGDTADIQTYLTRIQADETTNLINDFIVRQKEISNSKTLLNNFGIGVQIGNIRDIQTKYDRFVGFEIRPHQSNNIKVTLSEIGFQLDTLQPNNTFKIYFYSSDQLTPVASTFINNTVISSVEWTSLSSHIANYIETATGKSEGTRYYIGYYEGGTAAADELDGNSVETFMPCTTCGNSPVKKWGNYMSIQPIEIPSGNTYANRDLFDVESVGYTNATHGMHLKVNVECDITDVICDNYLLFANAIQKKIAIKIFWDVFNSTRVNRDTLMSKEQARLMASKAEAELYGGENIIGDLQMLQLDFTAVDNVCIPCKKRKLRGQQLR